jgi:hypothetical protein
MDSEETTNPEPPSGTPMTAEEMAEAAAHPAQEPADQPEEAEACVHDVGMHSAVDGACQACDCTGWDADTHPEVAAGTIGHRVGDSAEEHHAAARQAIGD